MARKSGLVRRHGGMVRQTLWAAVGPATATMAAASNANRFLVSNAALLALRPFTVIRMHVNWFSESDQTSALESVQVAMGFAVVSDQASAIGVTAVPTPFTDLSSDLWYLHDIAAMTYSFITGTGVQVPGGIMKDIDSKAMRKVQEGEQINGMLETSSLSDGAIVTVAGRMLLKLH